MLEKTEEIYIYCDRLKRRDKAMVQSSKAAAARASTSSSNASPATVVTVKPALLLQSIVRKYKLFDTVVTYLPFSNNLLLRLARALEVLRL